MTVKYVMQDRLRRRWGALLWRVAKLLWRSPQRTADLVTASYDQHAHTYDTAWTDHMRGLSLKMLDVLAPPAGAKCIDLTCGTGFITAELTRRTGGRATGVDASAGMLEQARRNRGGMCDFVQADVLAFLRRQPGKSVDVITCGWGLGYSRPLAVVREMARILRPGGCVGIIDNTLFSLAGVLWTSMKTFAERPDALQHAMRVRFLPNSLSLAMLMRLAGLGVRKRFDGAKTYYVPDGQSAIDRLTATGAAAGFEFAAAGDDHDAIFARFAELLSAGATPRGVAVTHRYLACIGGKS